MLCWDCQRVEAYNPQRYEDIPMSAITTNMANTEEAEQEQGVRENYEESAEQKFALYVSGQYALADEIYETETDNPDLGKFIEAQSIEPGFRQAVALSGIPNAGIAENTDEVILSVSKVGGVLQRFVHALLRARIFRPFLYSLLTGHPETGRVCNRRRGDFYWPHVGSNDHEAI